MVEVKPVAEEDLHESGMGCPCGPRIDGDALVHNTLTGDNDACLAWGVYENENIPPAPKELPHG